MKKVLLLLLLSAGFFTLSAAAQTTKAAADTSTQFSIADSATFIGKYRYENMPFEYMTVSVKEGKLYYEGGEYSGNLIPVPGKKDVFDANGEAVFTFLRGDATKSDSTKVTGLQIDYQGQSFSGQRE